MKKILIVFLLISCKPNAQTDFSKLDIASWTKDLEYLTSKINSRFAGFSPEIRIRFNSEAIKIRTELPSLTTNQKILSFTRLLALLGDGHTEISIIGPGSGFHRIPLQLYYFGKDIRILGIDKRYESFLGAKLIRIGNHPVHEVFDNIKPYINAENDIEYITTAPYFMIIPEVLQQIGSIIQLDSVRITVQNDDGLEAEIVLNAINLKEYNSTIYTKLYPQAPLYLDKKENGYWYTYLPESELFYINIRTLINHEGDIPIRKFIKDAIDEMNTQNCKKLVIDLRQCRGGNYRHIIPLVDAVKKNKSINIKDQIFVINGRLTFSAAAVATLFFKDQTQAIIVGEVSRARPNWSDNMEEYTLPHSKLEFDCTEKLKVHSPSLGSSDKIPVDVEIPRSFKHYKSGRDEVMEYILSKK